MPSYTSYTYSQHRSYANPPKYKSDHVISLLKTLQWLPISPRVQRKSFYWSIWPYIISPSVISQISSPTTRPFAHSIPAILASIAILECARPIPALGLLLFHMPGTLFPKIFHMDNFLPAFKSLLRCQLSMRPNLTTLFKIVTPTSLTPDPFLPCSTFLFPWTYQRLQQGSTTPKSVAC